MDEASQNVEAPGSSAIAAAALAHLNGVDSESPLQQGISRRTFLKLTGSSATTLALASLALGACTPQGANLNARSGGKVQLVYQDCRCLGEQLLFDQFHDLHPNIEVFLQPRSRQL